MTIEEKIARLEKLARDYETHLATLPQRAAARSEFHKDIEALRTAIAVLCVYEGEVDDA